MYKTVSLLLIAMLLGGCAAQTFNINGTTNAAPSQQEMQHFFISGLLQEQVTDAARVCGGVNKIIKVESQTTFINGLIGAVTMGIYTPRDAKVYCKR